MSKVLEGRIVLITGSARGIGEATSRLAHSEGATVVLHGRTDSPHLKKFAKELGVEYFFCDVSNKSKVQEKVQSVVAKFGRVDVLINCAGIAKAESFLEATDEHWLEVYRTNVLGVVNFCQAVIPIMQVKEYGRIVNIASIRGHNVGTSNRIMSYSVSKAAIVNLTAALAKEFAPIIAVNAVSPGFTKTDITENWNENTWRQVETSLIGRIGRPEEIAEAIVFLASDRASFITGQTLVVDGGYMLAGK